MPEPSHTSCRRPNRTIDSTKTSNGRRCRSRPVLVDHCAHPVHVMFLRSPTCLRDVDVVEPCGILTEDLGPYRGCQLRVAVPLTELLGDLEAPERVDGGL